MLNDSERAVIESFLQQNQQERWLELMQSDKGRKKLRAGLAHCGDFDPPIIIPIRPNQQRATAIHKLLTESGAPKVCSLISEHTDWDNLDMDLTSR